MSGFVVVVQTKPNTIKQITVDKKASSDLYPKISAHVLLINGHTVCIVYRDYYHYRQFSSLHI